MNIKNVRDKLPTHPKKEYPNRKLSNITHIDIHHSASYKKDYKGFQTLVDFARYHIEGHDWPGIGYHYVVAPDGQVFKTGYASESRWSVGGNNSYTISVMLIGRFDKENIDEKQYKIAVDLVKRLSKAYSVPAKNVLGHKEFPNQNTICPGINMTKFRRDLND